MYQAYGEATGIASLCRVPDLFRALKHEAPPDSDIVSRTWSSSFHIVLDTHVGGSREARKWQVVINRTSIYSVKCIRRAGVLKTQPGDVDERV